MVLDSWVFVEIKVVFSLKAILDMKQKMFFIAVYLLLVGRSFYEKIEQTYIGVTTHLSLFEKAFS